MVSAIGLERLKRKLVFSLELFIVQSILILYNEKNNIRKEYQKMDKKENQLIRFLGGKTPYYLLGLVVLSALSIFLLNQISFFFKPLNTVLMAILPSIVFAIVIYYIFSPLVLLLSKKLPKTWAVILVYALTIVLLVFAGIGLIQVIVSEAQELIEQFPEIASQTQKSITSFFDQTPVKEQIDQVFSTIDERVAQLFDYIGDNWQEGAQGLGSFFSAVSSTVITIFTGPVIAFFLLKDKDTFYRSLKAVIPPHMRADFHTLAKETDQQIGAFLKGQIFSALALGFMYWLAFLIMRLDYATIIATLAGVLSIIPYVGALIAFVPGLFIAAQNSFSYAVIFVIVWFVVQSLHDNLVVPKVMGDRLKIHPLTIMIVILVMGDLLGFMGILFGIPIYSMLKIIIRYIFGRLKKRYERIYSEKGKYE